MRLVIGVLAILTALASIAGPSLAAAPIWTDIIEGAAIPGPWSFYSQEAGNTVQTIIIDAPTLNRALVMTDDSYDPVYGKAQLTRPNWTDGPQGVTLHCRFMAVSGAADGALAIQIPEGQTGGDTNGLIKWGWYATSGGVMRLDKGNPAGTTFSAPADTWVEIWLTISSGQWKLWIKSGGAWGAPIQGSIDTSKAGVPYIGSGSYPALGSVMKLDFARLYIKGAYAPTDTNAPVLPPYYDRIGLAKLNYSFGYPVDLPDKIVTASWTEFSDQLYNVLYVQEGNRSAGVKVKRPIQDLSEAIGLAAHVRIRGYQDMANREVFVVGDGVTVTTPAPQVPVLPNPVYVRNSLVSAGKHGIQPAYGTGSYGCNNTGLRVRICGKVTQTGYDTFIGQPTAYVQDATTVPNDTLFWGFEKFEGIKVIGVSGVSVNDYVAIAGNAGVSVNLENGSYIPVVYCMNSGDVTKY